MSQTLKVELEIPSWVKWMAVDKNGTVYGYKHKPRFNTAVKGSWATDFKGMPFQNYVYLYKGPKPKNWKNELYTWG